MKKFPTPIAFKYPWRDYQQKVLDQLEAHLKDNKLHVVAPPGSGKTVLGLEVILQLNKPTLILAPTLAVKNQWIDRFCSLFLQVEEVPDWISTQITSPQFLTVSTYQGLHAAFNYLKEDEGELDEDQKEENTVYTNANAKAIIQQLKAVGIQTLLVDEVHHLRKEWWKALDLLDKELKATVVGLTATPPYGAVDFEWQRYIGLAGPVDEEIAIPELIVAGDLCPHQDFIYYSTPLAEEREKILYHKSIVFEAFTQGRTDADLVEILKKSTLFQQPMHHLDWIYENLTTYVACLIFLKDDDRELDKVHLKIVGLDQDELPSLDLVWFEKVLNFYCFHGQDFFTVIPEYEAHKRNLQANLKKKGLISFRQVQLVNDNKGDDLLLSSLSKLESMVQILDFEYELLGEDLRMVILTDYIRKEYYSHTVIPPPVLSKLGVLSIFETLRRTNRKGIRLAVLTGSIVIVPTLCVETLNQWVKEKGREPFSSHVFSYDDQYAALHLTSGEKADIVSLVTRLVQEGKINALVGTKSLLGEGWDAPAINTLIIASSIGAYITSNQIRGRAFRINPKDETKTANIWHLACLDTDAIEGGKDWSIVHRRFQTFVGISNSSIQEETSISNGIDRLREGNTKRVLDPTYREKQNQQTLDFAKQRSALKAKWLTAIQKGSHLVEGVKVTFSSSRERRNIEQAKRFYTNKTIVSVLFTVVCSAILFLAYQFIGLGRGILMHGISLWSFGYWVFQTFVVGLGFRFGWKGVKYYRLYRKFGDMRKDVQNIGLALCNTLCKFEIISTPTTKLHVISELEFGGGVFCSLEGATLRESNVFASCMKEILSPIDNPRYVIERKTLLPIQDSEADFHAVPTCLGINRKQVDYFSDQWAKLVGKNRVVYTRTPEGRRALLHARTFAIANQLQVPRVKQEHQWL